MTASCPACVHGDHHRCTTWAWLHTGGSYRLVRCDCTCPGVVDVELPTKEPSA